MFLMLPVFKDTQLYSGGQIGDTSDYQGKDYFGSGRKPVLSSVYFFKKISILVFQNDNMKSFRIIFILITVQFSAVSVAQINTYFQNNPEWQIHSSCYTPCNKNDYYNYYITGDTVLNAFTYKKIARKGQVSYIAFQPGACNSYTPYGYINSGLNFFIRSAGKKVYLRTASMTTDTLLYDFALSVGSVVPLSYVNTYTNITVSSIDSINTNCGYIRRFHLTGNPWSQFLLEGIGHQKGLFEPLNTPLDCGYSIICYGKNNAACYPSAGPTCDLPVSIDDIENNPAISVFPNPLNDHTTISFGKQCDKVSLAVYNMVGQTVKSISLSAMDSYVLKRDHLPSGIYFLQISADGSKSRLVKLLVSE
jgi:hypothetical protein